MRAGPLPNNKLIIKPRNWKLKACQIKIPVTCFDTLFLL